MITPNTKGRVLIVGISTRALVQSAVAAGWQVVSLDFFGDSDQPAGAQTLSLVRDYGQPPDLECLADFAIPLIAGVDAVVVEAGLENEKALFKVAHPTNTWNNPPKAVACSRDLESLRPLLQNSGMQIPETVNKAEILHKPGRYLVKNAKHSGGMGVREWDASTPLAEGEVLQEFIDGDLASACFLADGKRSILLGMTRQYAGVPELSAPSFAWCGNISPLVAPAYQRTLQQVADAITSACGLVGLNGIDFIIQNGRMFFLEVNPRPPASFELFERLLQVNAFQLHIEACQGRLPVRLPEFQNGVVWGKGILYTRRDVTMGDTSDWHNRLIADIPHSGEAIPAGAPICTLFAQSNNEQHCWQSILTRAAEHSAEILQNQ